MNKWQNMLGGLDIGGGAGLEFGPLMAPMVVKSQGEIHYIDHLDTEGLRAKYDRDPNVDTATIVDVDFVDDGRPLSDIVSGKRYDYVIASHVIEHIPNPLGWLNDCASVLNPGGRLALAVPDKRYTFDFFRPLTAISEWIEAMLERRRKPSVRTVYEAALLTAGSEFPDLWNNRPTLTELNQKKLNWSLAKARDAQTGYVDVHCTVATPASFRHLMGHAAQLDLHPFVLDRLDETERDWIEFQVRLAHRPDLPAAERAQSFRNPDT